MSLFEWLCESYNPGPTGTMGRPGLPPLDWPNWALLVMGLAIVALEGSIFYVLGITAEPTLERFGIACTVLLTYHLLAYLVQPEPDRRNIGWLGGLMDHPFRISDDVNRFMFMIKFLFLPGLTIMRIWVTLWRSGD